MRNKRMGRDRKRTQMAHLPIEDVIKTAAPYPSAIEGSPVRFGGLCSVAANSFARAASFEHGC
jgi:hypothetical protein